MFETEDLSSKTYKVGSLEIPIPRNTDDVINEVCDKIRMILVQQGKFVDSVKDPFLVSPVSTEIHILFMLMSDELNNIKNDIDMIKKRLDDDLLSRELMGRTRPDFTKFGQ